ncbi:SAM-dependent methyltransferase [Halomonas sp. DP1Y21-3]|uniref:methyltransferase n=1 Tax=Halomonas sp. DP1Y21-3 TaxID=2859080 RepID=UPI001C9630C7|nr:methyltransferase [Halomonas sp. DP1Y21-3]MBY6112296.1 SAM-dependent methyltransferase [Halomonas sp. DP1Y21-3]
MNTPLPHAERLEALTRLLADWHWLWSPAPFTHAGAPWPERAPAGDIAACLQALDDARCQRLQQRPFDTSPLAAWLPVDELARLVRVPDGAPPIQAPEAWAAHVGGRKWQQMLAFAPQVAIGQGQALVEWCAGKGHLSRLLARRHDGSICALEWQPALCESGQALAERQGLEVTLVEQDVMAPSVSRHLGDADRVVALHACGDLHVRLLELAREQKVAISLAPCCYQRTRDKIYRPLSRQAQQQAERHGLSLDREALALSVQETVTASQGERRKREQANAWRLGFDALQRRLRGVDDYLAVPSLAYGRMPERFEDFCRWAAREKGLTVPDGIDWDAYRRRGEACLKRVNRLELVRHLFRRPLEVWLVLDRALWLEEAGFEVSLSQFCPRALTPRNLALVAQPT